MVSIYVLLFVLEEKSLHMDVCKCIGSGTSRVNSGGDWETSKRKSESLSYPCAHFLCHSFISWACTAFSN